MDSNNNHQCYEDDDEVPLPGFRFHPTDEELVGFYLRRKMDKKPISIELIKLVDIYKYDPWDLPKLSSIVGEEEYYFFCRRRRKYKNSIRPNRVTGSGFWKATGIDKPVYSNGGEGQDCIGLKKTLVYYRGSAGKGSKTDWMMHEFRLPSSDIDSHLIKNNKTTTANIHLQEAEVLTLCRIFKRNVSHRKNLGDWKQLPAKRSHDKSCKSGCSTVDSNGEEAYISFANGGQHEFYEKKPIINYSDQRNQFSICDHQFSTPSMTISQPQSAASSASGICMNQNVSDFFTYNSWDELGSVMEFAHDPFQFPGDF